MATPTYTDPSTLPSSGGDIDAEPLANRFQGLHNFLNEASNIDEDNVDLTSTNGLMGLSTAQAVTGLKSFSNTSAAAGGVRTAGVFQHNPASGDAADADGVEIIFRGDDDGGNTADYGEIECVFTDTAVTGEDSDFFIKVLVAATARNVLSIGSAGTVFNEDSQDLDFRIETDNIANGFSVDAGLDTFSFGAAAVDDQFVKIATPTATHTATTNTYALNVQPGGAQTIPSGTTAYAGSVNIEEPNLTATGTVTNAFTLRVGGAPTEGGTTNYALWVDSGASQLDGTLGVGGALNLSTVAAAGSDTDKFLVLDSSGNVDYRTGAQVLSDIGGASSASGSGDFSGPGSSTDNAIVRFDGTGGKTGQTSSVLIDDSNNISGVGTLGSGAITSTGVVTGSGFTIGSAVIGEAELEILDGATVTTTELNLIDGGTARGTDAVASGDGILINDAGTMKMTNVDTVSTYFASHSVGGTNIATVGTISTGAWQGDVIASAYLDSDTAHLGVVQTFTANKTFTGTVTVGVDDDGKDVKFFGESAGAYMEWDESADQLRLVGPSADAAGSSGKLLLATAQTDVRANDVLGQIEFQAPLEAQDTDARAIAASIKAIAQDTFTASVNATDLIFYTGHSEAATEKFRITSQGELGVGGANYGSDGQVLTSTGAGTAPAWENAAGGASLSGSTDNGLVTATGADAMAAESTALYDGSQLQMPAGSAAAPSIVKVADTNSGISWPAGDNVVISTGGTEVARANEQNQLCMGGDNEFPPGCTLGAYNATQGRPVMALKSNANIANTSNLNNNIHSGHAHVDDDGAIRMTTESITSGYYIVTGRKDGSGVNSFTKTFFVMPGIASGGSIIELTSNIQGTPCTFSANATSVVPTGTTGTDGEARFSVHSSSGGFFFENRSGTLIRIAWFGFGVSG